MPDLNSYETPHILHDAPLRPGDEHHFHFDQFAVTLCRLIADKSTRTPLTIGISGSWGSGKTTLLQRVMQKLDEAGDLSDATKRVYWGGDENPKTAFRSCKSVWFDAWKYADEDELLVALIRMILATMAQGNLGDRFWSKALDKNAPRYNVIATLLSFFKFKISPNLEVSFDIEKYKEETPFARNTAFFDYFDDALEELLARWVHDTGDYRQIDESKGALVIFVDDLDRCLPEKTVQVLEAIKLFLDKHGCIYVLGADLNVVRSAVETHYHNTKITGETASDYLEKIVQLRFDLPPIVDEQMNAYLQAEAKAALNEETRRNWRLVMIGAEINPRKVKTFFNDLNLQWAMLKNTGQAQDVNRDDFTRWQVLMRVEPEDFRQRVSDIDDLDLRHKFILDALKWAGGETCLDATFRDYERSLRLRRVLREIKAFGASFDPATLDAFVHLAAPPPPSTPAAPSAPTPESQIGSETAKVPEIVGCADLRLEDATLEAKGIFTPNIQIWGGLEFVRIPAGKFLMGSKDDNHIAYDDEKPQHTVEIPYDYWLARYPVTNDQFSAFVEATQHVTLAEKEGGWSSEKREYVKGFDWRHPQDPKSDLKKKGDHPVVQVSWHDTMEYCKWLDTLARAERHAASQGLMVRLPTEAEWEKAARGKYGNEWPWGNEFDPNKCNTDEGKKSGTTPVGAYSPQGDSPYGAADMAGNVREWCHSLFKPYPYALDDGREDEAASGSRVLRGGSFVDAQRRARCAYRSHYYGPDLRPAYIGFRVCVSPGF